MSFLEFVYILCHYSLKFYASLIQVCLILTEWITHNYIHSIHCAQNKFNSVLTQIVKWLSHLCRQILQLHQPWIHELNDTAMEVKKNHLHRKKEFRNIFFFFFFLIKPFHAFSKWFILTIICCFCSTCPSLLLFLLWNLYILQVVCSNHHLLVLQFLFSLTYSDSAV